MLSAISFASVAFLGQLLYSTSLPIEEGHVVIYVTDAAGKRMSNIDITCREGCNTARSDTRGKVRLKLPLQARPGDWITLEIIHRSSNPDQVLISPWDNRVNIPPFVEESKNKTVVVVVRKGDRQILTSGKAIAAIIARVLKAERPKLKEQISAEERQRALQQQADEVGLTPDDVALAIREWGRKAKDPYQKGLAALFRRDYVQSTKFLEESERQRRKVAEKSMAELGDAIFFLGQSLYGEGRYAEAINKFQEASALRKNDADVSDWLGLSLGQAGRYTEAEPFFKRAIEIQERTHGKEHPSTAQILNNLAALYVSQGRYADAEPLLREALEIREKTVGKEHEDTAESLGNLAVFYHSQGRYTEAVPLFKRSLDIQERTLGKEHPTVAETLDNLGGIYFFQGKYAEAEPLLRRALEIQEKSLGKEHPTTATTVTWLGMIRKVQARYAEAEPLFIRAIEVFEKFLGKEHPFTVSGLANLAQLYYLQGNMRMPSHSTSVLLMVTSDR